MKKPIKYIVLLTLLALIFPGKMLTAEEKEKPREKLDVNVTVKKREKSNVQKKAGDGTGQPGISSAEILASTIEKKLVKGIDKTLAYLNKTLKSLPPKSDSRLEMMTRIHNLHMEQAVYVASEEQRTYDEQWKKWDANKRQGPEPRLTQNKSKAHWQKVSTTAQEILKEFPKDKRADVITFNQALGLSFLGQETNAARAFSQLIQKYPNSPIAGDAYFALGDYHFLRNDFRNAKNNFNSALKYRQSKRYGWSLFKLGWCHYNLGEYRQAEKYWKSTVSYSRQSSDGISAKLKDEALRDLVYVFAELKQVDPAINYFRANGGDKYIGQFLVLLAETFSDQGRFQNSIQVWQRLQAITPYSPDAARAQNEIISLYFDLNQFNIVWKELDEYYVKYGLESAWAKKNERKLVLETQIEIRDAIIYYAKVVHKNAQKSSNKALYEHAITGYKLFVKRYPKANQVAEIKYNLADIEFYQKRYRQAGGYYLEIAMLGKEKALIYNDAGKPVSNIHQKSSQYMLDAYNRDFEPVLKELIKNKPDFSKPPRPLDIRTKNFVKACGHYSQWYPKDLKTVQKCDTFIAEVYYRSNNKKLALKYLWMLATKYPNSKDGQNAVDNLIPLYKDDKKGLAIAVAKLLAIPAYQKGKTGEKLQALKRASAVELIVAEKNVLKRAEMYEARAKQEPGDADAPKFLNNAAVDYLSAGLPARAIGAYTRLVKTYPKDPLTQDATLQLGKLSDARIDFKTASSYYLMFASTYPKAKETPGAIQRACDLQIAIEMPSAIQTCSLLIRDYPENAKFAFEKMIENAWRKDDFNQMAGLINEHYAAKFKLSANEEVIANYKIYKGYNGDGPLAARAENRIAAILQKNAGAVSGEALRYVGEIAFKKANPVLGPYLKLGLAGGTVDAMLASINKKNAALAQVEKTFAMVVQTKDAYWGVAAYHQIGVAYENLSHLMKNPPSINGAKVEDVKKELAPAAAQAEAKAMEYFKEGLNISKKFEVYNEWPQRIKGSMQKMQGKTVNFDDWIITPDFVGGEVPQSVANAVIGG